MLISKLFLNLKIQKAIKIKDKFTYDNAGSNVVVGLGYTDNDMVRVSKMELVGKRVMADTKLDLTKNI